MNRRGFFGTLLGLALGVTLLPKKARAVEKEAVPHIAYLAVYVDPSKVGVGGLLSKFAEDRARFELRRKAAYIPTGLFFMDSMETQPVYFYRVCFVFRFHGRLIRGEKPKFDEAWRNRLRMREIAEEVRSHEWTPTLLGHPFIRTKL